MKILTIQERKNLMKPIDCFIHHHLGLGDHIICNGIVRYVAKNYGFDNISLVVKKSNANNVKRMFSDLAQVNLFVVDEDREFVEEYNSRLKSIPLIRVGFEKCRNADFDKSFYDSANVPFQERWNSWNFERDYEQEAKIIQELGVDGDYIFVHDESSTGDYKLNIKSDLRQIKPKKIKCENSVFDWIGVIENAKEIHAINSSFVHLIDSVKTNGKLYYHDIKPNTPGFSLRKNWELVNYG